MRALAGIVFLRASELSRSLPAWSGLVSEIPSKHRRGAKVDLSEPPPTRRPHHPYGLFTQMVTPYGFIDRPLGRTEGKKQGAGEGDGT